MKPILVHIAHPGSDYHLEIKVKDEVVWSETITKSEDFQTVEPELEESWGIEAGLGVGEVLRWRPCSARART